MKSRLRCQVPLVIAEPFDGAPTLSSAAHPPSRRSGEGELAAAATYVKRAARAARIELDDSVDPSNTARGSAIRCR